MKNDDPQMHTFFGTQHPEMYVYEAASVYMYADSKHLPTSSRHILCFRPLFTRFLTILN